MELIVIDHPVIKKKSGNVLLLQGVQIPIKKTPSAKTPSFLFAKTPKTQLKENI